MWLWAQSICIGWQCSSMGSEQNVHRNVPSSAPPQCAISQQKGVRSHWQDMFCLSGFRFVFWPPGTNTPVWWNCVDIFFFNFVGSSEVNVCFLKVILNVLFKQCVETFIRQMLSFIAWKWNACTKLDKTDGY